MLMRALNPSRLTGAGDVFVMAMYHPSYGPYEIRNEVTVLEPNVAVEWCAFSLGEGHGVHFGYALSPGDADTEVTSYCDWSALPAPLRGRFSLPFITSAQLAMTLENLEDVLRRGDGSSTTGTSRTGPEGHCAASMTRSARPSRRLPGTYR
jgi:hypothetical protein